MGDAYEVMAAMERRSWEDEARSLHREIGRLEQALDQALRERDGATEWADRLAYAIAPQSVIGEHSSLNNPWQNALDVVPSGVGGS